MRKCCGNRINDDLLFSFFHSKQSVNWMMCLSVWRVSMICCANIGWASQSNDWIFSKPFHFYDYFCFRHQLTPNTLDSLNQLVQLVQIGDYANGLQLHTQMVSGPDFSQIASFMPGIKVLLQTAMQLQVCLRWAGIT